MATAKYFPEWEKMTVREVREYLQERRSVILPLGIIEQHGYHLPLCTDALIAGEISKRVGRKIGMIVAPTVHMSFSGGELPGTINVNPGVMGLVVSEVIRSMAAQGFRNVFMILTHGGSENARALNDALKMLLRAGGGLEDVMLVLAPVWKFSAGWRQAVADHDWHAGWLETSMVMALAPELVQMDNLRLDPPDLVAHMREHPDHFQRALKPAEDEFVVPRMQQRPEIQVGVMGAPQEASRERGEKIVEDVVAQIADLFQRLEKERWPEYRQVSWTPEPIIL